VYRPPRQPGKTTTSLVDLRGRGQASRRPLQWYDRGPSDRAGIRRDQLCGGGRGPVRGKFPEAGVEVYRAGRGSRARHTGEVDQEPP